MQIRSALLLGFYAASIGNSLQTFRESLHALPKRLYGITNLRYVKSKKSTRYQLWRLFDNLIPFVFYAQLQTGRGDRFLISPTLSCTCRIWAKFPVGEPGAPLGNLEGIRLPGLSEGKG